MKAPDLEPWRHGTWEIMSYAWTEIGLTQAECNDLVDKFGIDQGNLDAALCVALKDVCASFAFDSL